MNIRPDIDLRREPLPSVRPVIWALLFFAALMLFGRAARAQTLPHPWSSLTGLGRPLGTPGDVSEQAWTPALLRIWITPIAGQSPTAIDVARNPTTFEVNTWVPTGSSQWCLCETFPVDLMGGEQMFELTGTKLAQCLRIHFEERNWYAVIRIEGYDAAGKRQFPTLHDGVRDVNEKPPVPTVRIGPPTGPLAPVLPDWYGCNGKKLVAVPPRRRPSGRP